MYCWVFKKLVLTFKWCLFHWFVMWTSKGQDSGIVRWQSDGSFGVHNKWRDMKVMNLWIKIIISDHSPNIENYSTKEFEPICNFCFYLPMNGIKKKILSLWLLLGALKFFIFTNLFYYLTYFWYYSWLSLPFLVLFMGLTVLFLLTFTFIYSIFSKKFSVSVK